jgi:type I restriction enzyme S subunit
MAMNMKDSGIVWIGEIPKDWELKKMKYHAQINPVGSCDAIEFDDDAEVSFVPMENLHNGFHEVSTMPYSKMKTGYTEFLEGDILIAKVTPCFENGNIAEAKNLLSGRGFGSTEILVIRCKKDCARYIYYYLQNPAFKERAISEMYGVAGLKRIPPVFFKETYLPMPSENRQIEIADFLDTRCAEIDAVIAAKQRQNDLLKEQRQSIIFEAVTKGLDPTVMYKDSGVEWIGEIPAGWEVRKIKYVAHMKSGESITATLIDEQGEYPVYGGNGLRGFTDNITHNGRYILIGRQGALCGNVHLVEGKFWASEHAIVVNVFEEYLTDWFGNVLQTMNLNQYSESAAQPGISVDRVLNLSAPIPPKKIQEAIVIFLNAKCAELDSVVAANNSVIDKLKEYRQSLIYEAVTGKIEV